jgi:hypothetical protein
VPGRAPDKNQGKTSTKEVWPWSYLQPVMAEDMAPRVRPRYSTVPLDRDVAIAAVSACKLGGSQLMRQHRVVQVQKQRPGEKGVWQIMHTDNGQEYYLNRVQNVTVWEVPEDEQHLILGDQGPLRPYDNVLFMPLKEFTEDPVAFELLHNGQTLQVRSMLLSSYAWFCCAAFRWVECGVISRPFFKGQ